MTADDVSVPPALADVISRSLEKKPKNRWQSIEELLPLFFLAYPLDAYYVPPERMRGSL